jgi:hypothetical protein
MHESVSRLTRWSCAVLPLKLARATVLLSKCFEPNRPTELYSNDLPRRGYSEFMMNRNRP